MDSLLENAQRIFDVASAAPCRTDASDDTDFALLIQPDGALHFVMNSPFSIEAAALHTGARTAYRVTRSAGTVRVQGRSAATQCVIEHRSARLELCRDQPLYLIGSPLLTSELLASTTTTSLAPASPVT